MKKIFNNKMTQFITATSLLVGVVIAGFPLAAHAESGSISLVSSSNSVTVGTTFDVTVNASTDAAVSTVQSKISYNASAVSLQGIDYTGSPFVNSLPDSSSGNGSIFISRFTVPPFPTGNVMVAKLTFKALSDTGNAGITSDKNASGLYSGSTGQNILSSSGNVTVNLVGIPPSGGGGSTGGSNTSGGGTSSGGSSNGGSNTSNGGSTSGGGGSTGGSVPGSDDSGSLNGGAVGTQAPTGSINGTPDANTEVVSKKKGVDGLSIAQYKKQATIGVTAAIFLGGIAYLAFYLSKRNMLPFNHAKASETPGAVIFDGSTHHSEPPKPVEPPSNIIRPNDHDPKV